MAVRKIIKIDEDKCNGCGQCITGCDEGALEIVNDKAKLVKDIFCDGLGACIGECPTGALTIEDREADAFDEEAVKERTDMIMKLAASNAPGGCPGGGCPGSAMRERKTSCCSSSSEKSESQLSHWPVQLTLVSPAAPFLSGAEVLLVADCVPFAFADFHQTFLAGGRPVLVACPKLDDNGPYLEKMKVMISDSGMKSLTVVHMEVPCCSGLGRFVAAAKEAVGSDLPVHDITVSVDGKVISEK